MNGIPGTTKNHAAVEEREHTDKLANVIVQHTLDNIGRTVKQRREVELNEYDINVRCGAILKIQGVVRRYRARKELKSLQAQKRIMNALQILMAELGRSDVKSMAMAQADTSIMEKLSRTAAGTPFGLGVGATPTPTPSGRSGRSGGVYTNGTGTSTRLHRSVSDGSVLHPTGTGSGTGIGSGIGSPYRNMDGLGGVGGVGTPSTHPVTPIDLSSPITKTFHTADSYYSSTTVPGSVSGSGVASASSAKNTDTNHIHIHSTTDTPDYKSNTPSYNNNTNTNTNTSVNNSARGSGSESKSESKHEQQSHSQSHSKGIDKSPNSEITASNTKSNRTLVYDKE